MADDRIFEAEIRDLEPQPTVGVRVEAPTTALAELFSTHVPEVLGRMGAAGGAPSGALFARYHRFGEESVDVEIGFPVAEALSGLAALADVPAGEVGLGELPGGRTAFTVHRGSYDSLAASYERLHDWIHGAGHDEGQAPWESYVDDPGDMSDVANVRTEIFWPLG